MQDRKIRGVKIRNIRTLDGIGTADSFRVRKGLFIRSGHLSDARKRDMERLTGDYGLRLVVDLRDKNESERHPDREAEGVEHVHLPYYEDNLPGISRDLFKDVAAYEHLIPDMPDLYRRMITEDKYADHLSVILRRIMAHRDGAVLWHCTAGKDRCGLTAALLLSVLGCDRQTVLEDYLISNAYAKEEGRKYRFLVLLFTRDRKLADRVYHITGARQEFFDSAMDAVEEYGGAEAYFTGRLGIPAEEIEEFRRYALEKA